MGDAIVGFYTFVSTEPPGPPVLPIWSLIRTSSASDFYVQVDLSFSANTKVSSRRRP